MKTLYININGEDIQSSEDIIVVGTPDDAIVDKFYYELGKEIVKGVDAPGIRVLAKHIVKSYKDIDELSFDKITKQWLKVKDKVLGEKPTGTETIELPMEYVKWLQNYGDTIHTEIAKSIYARNRLVEICLDEIYRNSVNIIINSIKPDNYEQFVVKDRCVKDDSAISLAIIEKVKGIAFVPYDDILCPNCSKFPCECKSETLSVCEEKQCEDDEVAPQCGDAQSECKIDVESNKAKPKAIYSDIDDFYNGLARVKKGDRYGYIDKAGKEVIECKYKRAEHFSESLASVSMTLNGVTAFVDVKGREVFSLPHGTSAHGCFKNGLCIIQNVNGLGYVDAEGNIVSECRYAYAHDFSDDGLALVGLYEGDARYINKSGDNMFSTWYSKGTDFKCGCAIVRTDRNWGESPKELLIDTHGKNFMNINWDTLKKSYPDVQFTLKCIDNMGFLFLFFQYRDVEKLMWFDLKNRYGVGDFRYRRGKDKFFGGFSKELLLKVHVERNEFKKIVFLGVGGNIVMKDFEDYGDFKEGLVPAKRKGKWGFANTCDEEVIQCIYEEVRSFSCGLAAVKDNGLWGFVDVDGEVVVSCQYSNIHDFREDKAIVERNGVYGVIDKMGNRII